MDILDAENNVGGYHVCYLVQVVICIDPVYSRRDSRMEGCWKLYTLKVMQGRAWEISQEKSDTFNSR